MRKDRCGNRVWVILALTFFATSIALSVHLILKEVITPSSKGSKFRKPSEDEILTQFPTYFRTLEEQQVVEQNYQNFVVSVNKTEGSTENGKSPENCTFKCFDKDASGQSYYDYVYGVRLWRRSAPQPRPRPGEILDKVKGRQVDIQRSKKPVQGIQLAHHACCISTLSFIDPQDAETLEGQQVSVVQFKSKRQYFPSEVCRQAQGCNGCRCGHQPSFTSAVVQVGADIKLELIVLTGSCKCFNTQS